MLVIAIVSINLALVFYSVGVWAETIQGRLKPWHLAFFWAGWVADTLGTTLMTEIAGQLTLSVHGVTGVIALVLMAAHAVWASVVLVRKDEKWLGRFHQFSLFVWGFWLIPYLIGAFFGAVR